MITKKLKKLIPLVVAASLTACAGDEFSLPGVEKDVFGNPKLDRTDTLGGVDADNNGVRDDIDKIINAYWPHEVQRQAARQLARSFRAALLVDKSNRIEVKKVDTLMSRAVGCAFHIESHGEHKINPVFATKKIEAFSTNTKERLLEYDKYSAALHGMFLRTSSGDTCDYK